MSPTVGFGFDLPSKSKSRKVCQTCNHNMGESRAGRPSALLGQRGARLVSERRVNAALERSGLLVAAVAPSTDQQPLPWPQLAVT
jgi:hypothetical protein